ncbi:MAG: hypothetical protein AAF614_25920, partial [Chloroflexota bacterium]
MRKLVVRTCILIIMLAVMLQTVAANSISGERLIAFAAYEQQPVRQRAWLTVTADNITTNAKIGDTLNIPLEIRNHGNAPARNIRIDIDGDLALTPTQGEFGNIPANTTQQILLPVTVNAVATTPYTPLITVYADNLVSGVQAEADIVLLADAPIENLAENSRFSFVEDGIRAEDTLVTVTEKQRFVPSISKETLMTFELSGQGFIRATTQKPIALNLNELITVEDAQQNTLTIVRMTEDNEPVEITHTYQSESNSIHFIPTQRGTYQVTIQSNVPTSDEPPASWEPTFNEPVVSEFQGAATYQFPVTTPPGPNGLQPNLAFIYNGGASNGVGRKTHHGPLGWGWSLGGMVEVSQGVQLCRHNGGLLCPTHSIMGTHASMPDDYGAELTLSIDGTGYELEHVNGFKENGYPGRYYVLGNAAIYAEYCNTIDGISASAICLAADDGANPDGYVATNGHVSRGYWVIKTAGNITYRLGHNVDAEQGIYDAENGSSGRMRSWSKNTVNNMTYSYAGALRWRVDTVSDVFDNTIEYTYAEHSGPNPSRAHAPSSYIDKITYGGNAIVFNLTPRNTKYGSLDVNGDVVSWQTHEFDSVEVQSPEGNTIRTYDLTITAEEHGSDDGSPDTPTDAIQTTWCMKQNRHNYEWKVGTLTAITELGGDGTAREYPGQNSPLSDENDQTRVNVTNTAPLPDVEFNYQFRPTRWRTENPEFYYCHPYLLNVFNVYGPPASGSNEDTPTPTASFEYQADDRSIGYERLDDNDAFVQVVTTKTVEAGWNRGTFVTTYDYEKDGAISATYRARSTPGQGDTISFNGFTSVTSTQYDQNAQVHLTRKTNYWAAGLSGRHFDNSTFNGRIANQISKVDNKDIIVTVNTWEILTDFTGGTKTRTPIIDRTLTEDRRGTTVAVVTDYTYDIYGNQTSVTTSGHGEQKKVETLFDPNVSIDQNIWIVNAPWRIKVYNWSTVLSDTEIRYDCDDLDISYSKPIKGLPCRQQQRVSHGQQESNNNATQWLTTKTAYGENGHQPWQPTTITDPAGRQVTMTWEGPDLPKERSVHTGETSLTTMYTYANTHTPWLLTNIKQPNGAQTIYDYDPFGRLTKITGPGVGGSASIVLQDIDYDHRREPLGISVQDIPGYGGNSLTIYDALGRPMQRIVDLGSSDFGNVAYAMEYDIMGNVICATEPIDNAGPGWDANLGCESSNHAKTTSEYDAFGFLERSVAPDGGTTIRTKDGLVETVQNSRQKIFTYTYDIFGRLRSVEEPGISPTTYGYDVLDNLTSVTQAGDGNTTITMYYNELGQKYQMEDPDMGIWRYKYDKSGNLVYQEDGNGEVICFYYNAGNQLTHKYHHVSAPDTCATTPPTGSNSENVLLAEYTYYTSGAGTGLVHTITGGTGEYGRFQDIFVYDDRGNVTKHTRTIAFGHATHAQTYTLEIPTYDDLGRPAQIIYPKNEHVTPSYDSIFAEGLSSNHPDAGTLVSNAAYNFRSQLEEYTLGSNVKIDYGYHDASQNFRLETIQHGTTSDDLPDFEFLTYDPMGNLTALKESTGNPSGGPNIQEVRSFTYDDVGRLLSETTTAQAFPGDFNQAYTYDDLGNFATFEGQTHNYAAWSGQCAETPTQSLPHAVKTVGTDYFCYDGNGN